MRRTDREITDAEKITQIIQTCHCCRLGFCDNGAVYIVPLNFGYAEENGKRVFYFHSANSGRKLDLIAGTPLQSVIGTGRVSFVEEAAQKEAALQALMLHNTGKDGWTFSGAMLDSVRVFKLEVETLSCKEHE